MARYIAVKKALFTPREFGISHLPRTNNDVAGFNDDLYRTACFKSGLAPPVAIQVQTVAVVVCGHAGCAIFAPEPCSGGEYVTLAKVPFTLRLFLYAGFGAGERARGSNAAPDNPAFRRENRPSGSLRYAVFWRNMSRWRRFRSP